MNNDEGQNLLFTAAEREPLRDDLVRAANQDERVTAAALVGSSASGGEDRWSDIDLALRIRPDLEPEVVARRWTERMYDDHGAVHHLDWWVGPALYRIFLLPNILQVDISFWPSGDFAASGPKFRLLFGDANDAPAPNPPAPGPLVGMGWLYARAAGSSLARGRRWQAVHMIDGLREQVVSLACVRFGLPARLGRGVDGLPPEETDLLADALPVSPDPADLRRALESAARLLLREARHADGELASRLSSPIEELTRFGAGPPQLPRG